jgi:hypothetical protein
MDGKSTIEKRCIKCGVVKPFGEFRNDKTVQDGHSNECRSCEAVRKKREKERRASTYGVTDLNQTKECKACNRVLPITAFRRTKNTISGWSGICRECLNQDQRARNSEIVYDKYGVRFTRSGFAQRELIFGIDLDWVDSTLEKQDGRCAICKAPFSSMPKKLVHIDHDHVTGKLRGFLCAQCNTVIGHAHDDLDVLKGAIRYLEDHSS